MSPPPGPASAARTYAVPFDRVWTEAKRLCSGGLRSWSLLEIDEREGTLRAEAPAFLGRAVDDVHVRVTLDEDAQTRLNVEARVRGGGRDWGRNSRRIGTFLNRLDTALAGRSGSPPAPPRPS